MSVFIQPSDSVIFVINLLNKGLLICAFDVLYLNCFYYDVVQDLKGEQQLLIGFPV